MVDLVQLVLLCVIIILTSVLVMLGVQVFFILSEVRKTVSKTNGLLEKADLLTESVQTPLSAFSTLVMSMQSSGIVTLAKFIRTLMGNERERHDEKRHHAE